MTFSPVGQPHAQRAVRWHSPHSFRHVGHPLARPRRAAYDDTSMTPEGLGLAIRRRRHALGLTIAEAAGRAGMHPGTWGTVECYCVHRVPGRLIDMARALSTSPRALLEEVEAAQG
jgi:hypothetical protein